MSLLDDKLDYSIETKRLIKSAIQSKGQAVSDQDTLRSYAQKIRNITDINAQTKTVTPTTSQQEIEPVAPYNAFDKVIVNAVTSAIDPDIQASNIKSGVTILGVEGTATILSGETVTINPSTSQRIVTPTAPRNGITQVTVTAVTASIDPNIVAGNIKKGVTILGVTGTLESVEDLDTELTALENQTQLLEDAIDDKTGDSE